MPCAMSQYFNTVAWELQNIASQSFVHADVCESVLRRSRLQSRSMNAIIFASSGVTTLSSFLARTFLNVPPS